MEGEDRRRFEEYTGSLERLGDLRVGDLRRLWVEYDRQNDILYINFGLEEAEESVMVDDDIVVGIKGDRVIGITIFNFSRRVGMEQY